jgi:hypothetical protein
MPEREREKSTHVAMLETCTCRGVREVGDTISCTSLRIFAIAKSMFMIC